REQRLKNPAAEFAVQAADAEARGRAALREPRHIEGLLGICGIDTAESEKTLQRCAIAREIALDIRKIGVQQPRREGVEARRNRRMRRENISCTRRPQRLPEAEAVLARILMRALDDGKGCMTFVDVADFHVR